jgi:hypothetical protein
MISWCKKVLSAVIKQIPKRPRLCVLGFISAVATQAVISAIGAQLLLAQIAIAYAVVLSVGHTLYRSYE